MERTSADESSLYAGRLQNMTSQPVFERIRRPSCMPSSSFMFSTIVVFILQCSFEMYRRMMAMHDAMKAYVMMKLVFLNISPPNIVPSNMIGITRKDWSS